MMVIVVKYIINTNFILIQKEYKFIVCEKKYYIYESQISDEIKSLKITIIYFNWGVEAIWLT